MECLFENSEGRKEMIILGEVELFALFSFSPPSLYPVEKSTKLKLDTFSDPITYLSKMLR